MVKRQKHTPEQMISMLLGAGVKLANGMAIAQICAARPKELEGGMPG